VEYLLAVSDDLVHWKKYPANPVIPVNPTNAGGEQRHDRARCKQLRLYTTHPDVRVYFPRSR